MEERCCLTRICQKIEVRPLEPLPNSVCQGVFVKKEGFDKGFCQGISPIGMDAATKK